MSNSEANDARVPGPTSFRTQSACPPQAGEVRNLSYSLSFHLLPCHPEERALFTLSDAKGATKDLTHCV
jgi:hypothetical protein